MEIIYPKVCGVDVHKSFIVAVICDSTSITPKYYNGLLLSKVRKTITRMQNGLQTCLN